MIVVSPQAVDVHGDACGLGEALKAVGHHLAGQAAEPLAAQAEVDDGVGPVGQVDDGAGEGLVEGSVGVAEAGEAGGGAEGGGEGGTEGYGAVFGGVVVVDGRGGGRGQSVYILVTITGRMLLLAETGLGGLGMKYCADRPGS